MGFLKILKCGLCLFCMTVFLPVSAQFIGFDEIEDRDVSSWRVDSPEEYQGIYDFGDSETESKLMLVYANGEWYAQVSSFSMSPATKWEWVTEYRNLKNVRVEDNFFFSEKYEGEFVMYYNGKELKKGLKIQDSWTGYEAGIYEIGLRSDFEFEDALGGLFPYASIRELTMEELLAMSARDLKIMRNEIFARYGYQFIKGGEMDIYFRKQQWYTPYHDDVSRFLNGLEVKNIELIRKAEKAKQ